MSIEIQQGISITGGNIKIGRFPVFFVSIVEEDLTTLILTESGDQIIEEP
jgi:hypothetical protein